MTPDPSPANEPELIEELVFQCLEAGGGTEALDKVTAEHPHLRDQVARVLADIEAPFRSGVFADEPAAPAVPDRMGGFALERRLGAGGMGEVYLARELDLDRKVALKVIRADQLHSEGARERFRREAEAVSRLQHPNIVPVFAVGDHAGMPFFTMEYVEGCSLGAAIERLRERDPAALSGRDLAACAGATPARPESGSGGSSTRTSVLQQSWTEAMVHIAVQVAEALQHAHDRGVLHRDVKPSNILITADGRARLMDFGLAKTEGAQQITQSASHLGSLPYMTPEQVGGGSVPHATQDVYALGVTLHEALALRSPFLDADSGLTRRNILDGRIPPLRERNRAVSGDLETVCLVAMDLDPAKRYASAAAFAADLDNVRARRPISARRPSLWGRAVRYAQRKPAASAAMALGLALIAGLPTALYFQERSARAVIETETAVAHETTRFLIGLFEAAGPEVPLGEKLAIGTFLETGSEQLRRELSGQPEVKARMLATLGKVYDNLGSYAKAGELLREAEALLAEHVAHDAESLTLVRWELAATLRGLGQYRESATLYESVVDSLERLRGRDDRSVANARSGLGLALHLLGRNEEAATALRDAVSMQRRLQGEQDSVELTRSLARLGVFLVNVRRPQDALPFLVEAVATAERLDHPGMTSVLRSHLCRCRTDLGQLDAAAADLAASITLADGVYAADHPMRAVFLLQQAMLERARGDLAAAETTYREAIAIREQTLGREHVQVAHYLNGLGTLLIDRGKPGEALPYLERALALYTASDAAARDAAVVRGNLADACAGVGQLARAESEARAALGVLQQTEPEPSTFVATAWNSVAWVLLLRGDGVAALRANARAVALFEQLDDVSVLHARACTTRALLEARRGDGAAAELAARRALDLLSRAGAASSIEAGRAQNNLGWALELQRRATEAEAAYRSAIALFDACAPEGHPDAGFPLNGLGALLLRTAPKDGVPYLRRALDLRRRLLPPGDDWIRVSTHNLAVGLHFAGDDAGAWATMQEAIALARPRGGRDLAGSLFYGAQILTRLERYAQAAPLAAECVPLLQALYPSGNAQVARALALHGDLQRRAGAMDDAEGALLAAHAWLTDHSGDDAAIASARAQLHALYTEWGRPDRAEAFAPR